MSIDINTLNEELDYLAETKGQIKQAIINKGQTIEADDNFRSYVEKIENIETGVDTSDATAVAEDIAQDKTAYVNGQKVTGNIRTLKRYDYGDVGLLRMIDIIPDTKTLTLRVEAVGDTLLREGCEIPATVSFEELAQSIGLTGDKIIKGETIIGVTGTAEVSPEKQEELEYIERLTDEILGL